jgi:hypothetical protein
VLRTDSTVLLSWASFAQCHFYKAPHSAGPSNFTKLAGLTITARSPTFQMTDYTQCESSEMGRESRSNRNPPSIHNSNNNRRPRREDLALGEEELTATVAESDEDEKLASIMKKRYPIESLDGYAEAPTRCLVSSRRMQEDDLFSERCEKGILLSPSKPTARRRNRTCAHRRRCCSQPLFGEGRKKDDVVMVMELFSNRKLAGMPLNIVSDNPISHVRPAVKRTASSTSRIAHSPSPAPSLQCRQRGLHFINPTARWGVGVAVGRGDSALQEHTSIQPIGLGNMKIPSRSNIDSIDNESSQNARWDAEKLSIQLRGNLAMDKKRSDSLLGVGGFAFSAQQKQQSAANPCRWSIPKHASDSALTYPRRQDSDE